MEKKTTIDKFKISANDTGSTYVQIALLTERIKTITEHLKKNPKDNHSTRGLLKLVGQRKRMLSYLEKKDINAFRKIKADLNIR